MHKNTRLFFLFVDDVNWFFLPPPHKAWQTIKNLQTRTCPCVSFLSILIHTTWNDFIVVSIDKIIQIFQKTFFIEKYHIRSMIFVIDIFRWFSSVFRWFSDDFSMIFRWFFDDFSMTSDDFLSFFQYVMHYPDKFEMKPQRHKIKLCTSADHFFRQIYVMIWKNVHLDSNLRLGIWTKIQIWPLIKDRCEGGRGCSKTSVMDMACIPSVFIKNFQKNFWWKLCDVSFHQMFFWKVENDRNRP